jgi:hypothetical protein
MQKNYSDHLSSLCFYLKEMKKNCQEYNWESLTKNEKEREKIMKELKLLQPDDSIESIKLTKKVIQLNKEVMDIANENKDESEKALLEIKRNLKKTNFYQ